MELIFLALCFITLALIYFFAENRLLLTRKYKIRLSTDTVSYTHLTLPTIA